MARVAHFEPNLLGMTEVEKAEISRLSVVDPGRDGRDGR